MRVSIITFDRIKESPYKKEKQYEYLTCKSDPSVKHKIEISPPLRDTNTYLEKGKRAINTDNQIPNIVERAIDQIKQESEFGPKGIILEDWTKEELKEIGISPPMSKMEYFFIFYLIFLIFIVGAVLLAIIL